MKNIIAHLHTQEFNRIRVGIGKDARVPVVNWVLGKIRKEEQEDFKRQWNRQEMRLFFFDAYVY